MNIDHEFVMTFSKAQCALRSRIESEIGGPGELDAANTIAFYTLTVGGERVSESCHYPEPEVPSEYRHMLRRRYALDGTRLSDGEPWRGPGRVDRAWVLDAFRDGAGR
jgi:hypothetical protein